MENSDWGLDPLGAGLEDSGSSGDSSFDNFAVDESGEEAGEIFDLLGLVEVVMKK